MADNNHDQHLMPTLTRRQLLTGMALFAAGSASARPRDWHEVRALARALDQCRAIAVYQHGREVLFEMFRGPSIETTLPIKSVSKTVVAALTGAALDRGEIPSIQSTLDELAPDLIPRSADPKVGSISVENLVTMQAGLEPTSGRNYYTWINSRNWVANALSRPMVAEPGSRMLYSTGSSHVLGAILTKVSGLSLLALARQRIGQPLRIDIPTWTRDPQGRYLGGNEMALTLSAMIRFGEMYRNGGRSGDLQVLSDYWVTRSQVPVTRSMFSGLGYGYGWFIGSRNGTVYSLARGYGGQIICIIPELELTLAIASDPLRPARTSGYFGELMRLIEETIIPVAAAHA